MVDIMPSAANTATLSTAGLMTVFSCGCQTERATTSYQYDISQNHIDKNHIKQSENHHEVKETNRCIKFIQNPYNVVNNQLSFIAFVNQPVFRCHAKMHRSKVHRSRWVPSWSIDVEKSSFQTTNIITHHWSPPPSPDWSIPWCTTIMIAQTATEALKNKCQQFQVDFEKM